MEPLSLKEIRRMTTLELHAARAEAKMHGNEFAVIRIEIELTKRESKRPVNLPANR